MLISLLADLNDLFRPDRVIARATLGVQKLQQFLKRFRIGGAAQESAFAPHMYEVFRLELVKMMRQSGIRDIQLFLNLADDEAIRVSRQQQLHDSQTGFRSHCGEHVRVLNQLLVGLLRLNHHISMIAEIQFDVKSAPTPLRGSLDEFTQF
jgi:hypothetical protein